jgi:hypothetical protein
VRCFGLVGEFALFIVAGIGLGFSVQARDIEMGGDGPVTYSVTAPLLGTRPTTSLSHPRHVKSRRAAKSTAKP